MDQTAPYDALARLVSYPRPGYAEAAEEWAGTVSAACPEAAAPLRTFLAALAELGADGIEELYMRTFDVSQEATLDLGWHAHGESYARGAFLVEMRGLLRAHGLAESGELPDHLSHVLPVLARVAPAQARRLAQQIVIPALRRIAVALAAGGNPFEHLIDAVLAVLGQHHGAAERCC